MRRRAFVVVIDAGAAGEPLLAGLIGDNGRHDGPRFPVGASVLDAPPGGALTQLGRSFIADA